MPDAEDHRGLLVNIAYRILGSVAEAEDAAQESFARWYALSADDRDRVDSQVGWLVTVTTRICLDVLRSARVRHERYVGEWLPEPVPGGTSWTSQAAPSRRADPADRVALDESLSMALLIVLESMTPAERVSFVLHDVFRYTFAEIAEIVGRSPQACRQLASSGRRRVRESRTLAPVAAGDHARAVAAFAAAMDSGELAPLIEVLDPDVAAIGDGGGIVRAAVDPIVGADRVARYLLGLREAQPALRFRTATVNEQPGIVIEDGSSHPVAVASVRVRRGLIERLWVVRNPQKLISWQ